MAGRKIFRIGMRVRVSKVVSKPGISKAVVGQVPSAFNSACNASGRPDCWSSLDVEFGSVTQQSISEFAIVKVFAKLPKSSTFAAKD